jgi:hypothetical protein
MPVGAVTVSMVKAIIYLLQQAEFISFTGFSLQGVDDELSKCQNYVVNQLHLFKYLSSGWDNLEWDRVR